MTEFEIRSRDRDTAFILWIIGMLIMALLTITIAFSENIEGVIRDMGLHVGTVLIVMFLGLVAWFTGRGKIERAGLWKYL